MSHLSDNHTRQFLQILDQPFQNPSLEYLNQLILAFIHKIPFENISKMFWRKHSGLENIPPIDRYLNSITEHHFGGTCYSNNYYFFLLLKSLGFKCKLCGADMLQPLVHCVSVVTFNDKEFLLDVGYAAPFDKAFPVDSKKEIVVYSGNNRYVFKPQINEGILSLEMYRNEAYKHGYKVHPEPRGIEDFTKAIKDSFNCEATFMNSILLAKKIRNKFVVIHNFNLFICQGRHFEKYEFGNKVEVAKAVERYFSIPEMITLEVINEIQSFGDSWN